MKSAAIVKTKEATFHTPAPWRVGIKFAQRVGAFNVNCFPISGGGSAIASVFAGDADRLVSLSNGEANAAHIVKCVNAHDELVRALRQMLADADTYGYENVSVEHPMVLGVPMARAVLAKVQP